MESKCDCIVTQCRKGEKGSWCVKCGIKVYDVENRPCKDCKSFRNGSFGSFNSYCANKLMGVTSLMNVTFKIEEGTCFIPKTKDI